MATKQEFVTLKQSIAAQRVHYAVVGCTGMSDAQRAGWCDELMAIADRCIARFDPLVGGALDGAEVCDTIARRSKNVFGRQTLSTLAARLADYIRNTPEQPGLQRRASTKPTWVGVKSYVPVFTNNPAALLPRASEIQLVIQTFSEEKENGVRPPNGQLRTGLWGDPEVGPLILPGALADLSTFTACHPTALGLQRLLGRLETEKSAGGAGTAARAAAIQLATQCLQHVDRLFILWVKCTARGDGHSFSLLMNHDGTVTSLEAWAMNVARNAPCGLVNVFSRPTRIRDMAVADACAALELLLSEDIRDRDRGYGALSVAYGREHPAHHFEERDTQGHHDARENHLIQVTVRELRPREKVRARMAARLVELQRIVG
ncbi:hypothetical protein [Chondromyces apiculatus]|uniref:Uncharacterized protein n=1 Tax=Chondromyces apiculatus DSM 436 TaxID=1192034 RepID=A0A017TCL5_9BACT|nr:hypothetical protein [Chondromyces apiculatus]EYF06376.1 Hypothetical protein CAP_1906 [Chondromyces apiculatus DSM 436]